MTTETDAHRIEPFWDAQVAIAAVIALYAVLPERLSLGPRWAFPAVGGVLLAILMYATPWKAAKPPEHSKGTRRFAFCVMGLVSLATLTALARLIYDLIDGNGLAGKTLLGAAATLWLANVLVFAVWFWELDRGGPVVRSRPDEVAARYPDFFFQQMDDAVPAPRGWMPAFIDYLYLSFTNSTAFSPTDVMPLTASAKLLMLAQSFASFLTVALVAARAVNILG